MQIKVVRRFKIAEDIHPIEIPEGVYSVEGKRSIVDKGTVCEHTAELALSEGWAAEHGHQYQSAGPEKPSASSQAAPAPQKKTRKKSKAGRKS